VPFCENQVSIRRVSSFCSRSARVQIIPVSPDRVPEIVVRAIPPDLRPYQRAIPSIPLIQHRVVIGILRVPARVNKRAVAPDPRSHGIIPAVVELGPEHLAGRRVPLHKQEAAVARVAVRAPASKNRFVVAPDGKSLVVSRPAPRGYPGRLTRARHDVPACPVIRIYRGSYSQHHAGQHARHQRQGRDTLPNGHSVRLHWFMVYNRRVLNARPTCAYGDTTVCPHPYFILRLYRSNPCV